MEETRIYLLFYVLIGFQLVHWIADYVTTTPKMIEAKRFADSYSPIFLHSFHHTGLAMILISLTFLVYQISCGFCSGCFSFTRFAIAMLILQTTHFLIDVMKGKLTKKFEKLQSPMNKIYWVYMGFDQFLHQIINVFLAIYIVF